METKWKTMSVENKHISEGTPDNCHDCPIALAMRDYEPVFDRERKKGYKVHISQEADCWFGEDAERGAMSHKIIVHPDDRYMVEEFIKDFDASTFDNPYRNDKEEYYEWDEQHRFENFAPFTFKYRVVNWQPREIQGESK